MKLKNYIVILFYDFAGSIDIEKDYNVILQFHPWSKTYKIKVYEPNELKPCLDFYAQYKYPWFIAGFTCKNKGRDKVIINRV